jgi:hypothetical protein
MNRAAIVLSVLTLALATTQTRADIFAAVNVAASPPRTDLDVAIVNASLGTRVSLPSLVNTTANETSPSVSSDGRRLLFKRVGADGLLLVDTSTGDSASLFSIAETLTSPIFDSTLTRDGRQVLTGRRLRPIQGSDGITRYFPVATVTDVSAFPTGPYPRSTRIAGSAAFSRPGRVTDVAVGGPFNETTVFRVVTDSSSLGVLAFTQFGRAAILRSDRVDYGLPAVGSGLVYFDYRTFFPSSGTFGTSRLAVTPADPVDFGEGVSGVTVASAGSDESQPAPSENGRYLAAVRHDADGHDRLFVVDRDTRTQLNPNGVDLGVVTTRGSGAVSLYQQTVLTANRITTTGVVTATLASASSIGILVQRIVGVTIDRGHERYELEAVGRVPLGFFHTGELRTQWNFAVAGEPLAPGNYLVTVRAVEGDVVRELGESQVLRIDEKGRAHMKKEKQR